MNPLISVIIPTFNRKQTLKRAIESVKNQSYQNWELMIVDDGSTDGTIEFLKDFSDCRILSLPSSGVSRARNAGAQEARGHWLAFLDSDDEWFPHKLEKQVSLISSGEKFSLIHGEETWIRNGIRVNPKLKYKKSGGHIFKKCVEHCCISASTVLIEREYFLQKKGFREDFVVCEDYEFWLRASIEKPIGFVADALINKYGGHEDQLSRKYHSMDYFRVKALQPFLQDSRLKADEQKHVAEEILKKCEILLKGYEKHNELTQAPEVTHWQQEAQSFFNT